MNIATRPRVIVLVLIASFGVGVGGVWRSLTQPTVRCERFRMREELPGQAARRRAVLLEQLAALDRQITGAGEGERRSLEAARVELRDQIARDRLAGEDYVIVCRERCWVE